jgi:hypothetical protein
MLRRAGIARFDHNALYIYPAIPGTMPSSTPTGRVGTALATATFRGLAGDTLFIDHLDSNAMTVRFVRCNAHSCRNEGVTDTHIYAPNGMITHGLLTLSAITAQHFLSLW